MNEQIFTNAKIVLANEVVEGTLTLRDDKIYDISHQKSSLRAAIDMGGDYVMPGLIELHTDNLEKHMTPRPKTEWPSIAAIVAHDNQVASAGITTVFDAIAVGDVKDGSARVKRLEEMVQGLSHCQNEKLLRAEHLIHLRCEVSYPAMAETLDRLANNELVRMFSVMDHTPGQRQFVSLEAYYIYYQGKYGMNDDEMKVFTDQRKKDQELYSVKNRKHVVETAHRNNMALASHDDATIDHVAEAVRDKMTVAEFPTTVEAAKESHKKGLSVMMGGPNMVRGGSHSGNVAAGDLAKEGYLDIISSDYIPHSLLHAAMVLFENFEGYDLSRAIRTVTKTPADSVGLTDRGEIAIGKRADIIHVHHSDHHPVIRGVWRQGVRVS